jgi:pyruvate,water dikinase
MSHNFVLPLSAQQAALETVGGKGASLARLVRAGLPVPDGYHVTTDAYRRFITENDLQPEILRALESVDIANPQALEDASKRIAEIFAAAPIPDDVANAIVQSYASLPGVSPAVAVRSSATAEDLPEASFAGQQETYLNVSGAEEVLEATRKCWTSLWTARAISYRARQGIDADGVALAVVVQMLVPAEAAGIMFTANPINGQRDQLVISASWGLGEAVVGGMVTPDNLTLEKTSFNVIDRETAGKLVQTVRVNGGTEEQPVPENLRQVPVLSDSQAATLARLGTAIEDLYGMPLDIEWTLADGEFAIVQARPITALPEPEAPIPTDWPMPNPKGQYMRASIIDLMPDPLSPLFATLGLGAINRGISKMSTELIGMPEDFVFNLMKTINGYAYQEVSFTPRQWWLMLTRMVPAFPRLIRDGIPYWRDMAHPQYVETIHLWSDKPLSDITTQELLTGVNEVVDEFAQHLGALMASTMGPTSGTEGLFTQVYEKLVRQDNDPPAPTFLLGFENAPLRTEKALYDLAIWCREQDVLRIHLTGTPTAEVTKQFVEQVSPPGIDLALWEDWRCRFRDYLDQYGYSIYDMDFSKPLPMDEPGPLLEMLKQFINGQIQSPYERQEGYVQRREQAERAIRNRLKRFKRWAFEKTLKWAQERAPLREDGIASIGLGFPLLRGMLRELGYRFAEAGVLQNMNDIYWLERSEVESLTAAIEQGRDLNTMVETVNERKKVWAARKRITPPPQLPPGKKYMGFDMEAFLAGGEDSQDRNTLRGVAASPGQVTATARVLHGPEDFSQLQPGDILVAGITTPAWTPLFPMAAGVVTDIGGPLSHGSIVAREYGIPAVLGTGIATRRIKSGQTITVDGSAGTVKLPNGSE